MKLQCDFCKTQYNIDRMPTGAVRCAVCGHVWTVRRTSAGGAFLVVASAVCALIAAGVFATAVITRHRAAELAARPLVATVTDVATQTDAAGVSRLVVRGTITNQSAQIYGVPDLIIVARDTSDRVVARQKFMPSATLLDAGGRAEFSYTLTASPASVRRISVELAGGDL